MRSKFNFLILLLIFPAFSSALFVSFFPRVGECLFLYFSSFGFLNDLFINFKLYGFRYDYQVLFFLINFLFCFFVFVLISFSGFHVRYSGGFFYDVFAISILIFCFFINSIRKTIRPANNKNQGFDSGIHLFLQIIRESNAGKCFSVFIQKNQLVGST